MEYQLEMDMGGWVPSVVTDYVSDEMPVHTLLGLKQQVKRVAAEGPDTASGLRMLSTNSKTPQSR